MIKSIVLLCLLIGLWTTTTNAQETPKRTQSMRAVIQQSLPFIEERVDVYEHTISFARTRIVT